MGSQHYAEAANHLSSILSLDTEDRAGTLQKRSQAHVMASSWDDALKDADEVYFGPDRHG